MLSMRTTVTIDDDLAVKLEDLSRREKLSFKGALNKVLRDGLQFQGQPPKPASYRTPTRKLGLRAGFDSTKLNQLVDELEAEAFTTADGE